MAGEVLTGEDYDVVAWLGENSLKTTGFILKYSDDGKYSNIRYSEPKWGGLREEIGTKYKIEKFRIADNIEARVRGQRALIVWADFDAVDANKSIVDKLLLDMKSKLEEKQLRLDNAEKAIVEAETIIRESNLERTFTERLLNMLELIKHILTKTGAKAPPTEAPAVAVEVGKEGKK